MTHIAAYLAKRADKWVFAHGSCVLSFNFRHLYKLIHVDTQSFSFLPDTACSQGPQHWSLVHDVRCGDKVKLTVKASILCQHSYEWTPDTHQIQMSIYTFVQLHWCPTNIFADDGHEFGSFCSARFNTSKSVRSVYCYFSAMPPDQNQETQPSAAAGSLCNADKHYLCFVFGTHTRAQCSGSFMERSSDNAFRVWRSRRGSAAGSRPGRGRTRSRSGSLPL